MKFTLLKSTAAAVLLSSLCACGTLPETKTEAKPVQKTAAPKKAAKRHAVKPYELKLTLNKKDGIYKKGDTVVFTITAMKDGKPADGLKMGYYLYPQNGQKELFMFTANGAPHQFKTVLNSGYLRIEAAVLDESGKILQYDQKDKKISVAAAIGAIADPYEIRTGVEEPADFQKFWDDAKAELAKVPLKAKREAVSLSPKAKDKFNAWDVKVDSVGDVPVSGYLTMPVNAAKKSLPAVVSFHGAGVYSANKPLRENAISFDVNAHGVVNGQNKDFYQNLSRTTLSQYWCRDAGSRDKFYFRNMFLRVQRALDYVKSLPEWDGKTLVVLGSSQGGAQSLVAGGLDPQVTLLYAIVPAMCDHGGCFAGRESGWPRLIKMKDGKPVDPAIASASRYFDAAYFAKRIKAECYLTVGLIDNVCVPSSVFAAYNNIPGKKHITVHPNKGHSGEASSRAFNKRLKQVLTPEKSGK